MKKFAIACFVSGVTLFASSPIYLSNLCVDEIEREIIDIIYSGSKSRLPKEEVTKKVSKTFEERCADAESQGKQVIAVQKTADVKECVIKLEDEILRIINEAPDGIQEIDLKILIDDVSQNFQECKPEE